MSHNFPDKYKGGFRNNLDLARLSFASAVVFLHYYHLTPTSYLSPIIDGFGFITGNAVAAFFVVSGFVVYMSFDHNRNLKYFFISRMLRLYPAYVIVILLCAFGLFAVSGLDISGYFDEEFVRYLGFNLAFLNFLQPTIHDVFANSYGGVVNGALWSLKIEVMFYCIVPLIHFLTTKYGVRTIFIMYVIGQISIFFNDDIAAYLGISALSLDHQLPAQLTLFASGILLYLYYDVFRRYWMYFAASALACLYFDAPGLQGIAFSMVVIGLFVNDLPQVRFSRLGDISYGVYIYHFPTIQLVVFFGVLDSHPLLRLILILFVVFCAAVISHRFVEIPAMRLKSRFKPKG